MDEEIGSSVEQPKMARARSHAHEKLPGTVYLKPEEGDTVQLGGQALFPVPSEDPNDPLLWPQWKKTSILIICSLYSFLGNSALLGPSVYISVWTTDFNITPSKASGLVSYPNLTFGCGSLLLVPAYIKFGRRPVMLLSLVLYAGGLIGCALFSRSYEALMVTRLIHALGSGICEALPVQLVNDIFFLHERGTMLGYYTICLCMGAGLGPLFAGYLLTERYSWNLFFFVQFGLAIALTIATFLIVEETRYKRDAVVPTQGQLRSIDDEFTMKEREEHLDRISTPRLPAPVPTRKTYVQSLAFWSGIDREAEFWTMIPRSFTYLAVPAVFWVTTTYGLFIGCAALAFSYTFPIKITAPPYNWSPRNAGLISIGNALGYILAIPLSSTSDRLAAYLTRRNNHLREAEMRLGVLLPAMFIIPGGLVVYGLTGEYNLHWLGYFFGMGMLTFGGYFYLTFTLAYAIDSHNAIMSELLMAMNMGKTVISFGVGFKVLDWVEERGYATIIAGILSGVLFVNCAMVVVFMVVGKRMRVWYSTSRLQRMQRRTAIRSKRCIEGET